jgi:hypothetical protein
MSALRGIRARLSRRARMEQLVEMLADWVDEAEEARVVADRTS